MHVTSLGNRNFADNPEALFVAEEPPTQRLLYNTANLSQVGKRARGVSQIWPDATSHYNPLSISVQPEFSGHEFLLPSFLDSLDPGV
jgi:hypothetical protein